MIFPIMRIRDLTIDDFYANIDMFDKYNGRNTYALEMSEKYAKSRVAQSLAKCFFPFIILTNYPCVKNHFYLEELTILISDWGSYVMSLSIGNYIHY